MAKRFAYALAQFLAMLRYALPHQPPLGHSQRRNRSPLDSGAGNSRRDKNEGIGWSPGRVCDQGQIQRYQPTHPVVTPLDREVPAAGQGRRSSCGWLPAG